ncbi:MAG: hypothetical protein SLAVMIC_00205 [uncultured marine phage]|uniref:Uncharacterized protein n=1 Tax=uncultured marine phage TaxID=707152 RepID=A0A8D9CDQ6_9VIRU|nr:MAG: hypothetical protein SLAVMIC_00205 [uncultured marine phage]
MKFEIGDKVIPKNDRNYVHNKNQSVRPYIRNGSLIKEESKMKLRGMKIIDIVPDGDDYYYIGRYLDSNKNYVDLGYEESNLEPFKDCEPNIITVSDFGDLSNSLSDDYKKFDKLYNEIKFDNFNLNYFIGKSDDGILIIRTDDGVLDYSTIINAFKITPKEKIKMVSGREFHYLLKDMRMGISEFELNHRPLIIKKI